MTINSARLTCPCGATALLQYEDQHCLTTESRFWLERHEGHTAPIVVHPMPATTPLPGMQWSSGGSATGLTPPGFPINVKTHPPGGPP